MDDTKSEPSHQLVGHAYSLLREPGKSSYLPILLLRLSLDDMLWTDYTVVWKAFSSTWSSNLKAKQKQSVVE